MNTTLSKTALIVTLTRTIFTLSIQCLIDKIEALVHYYTYKPTSSPKNVLVIGASYAGYVCAEHLSHTLPSGYRVILIEKNTHFNHTWLFPRTSVFAGSQQNITKLSYIPYPEAPRWAPRGSYLFKNAKAVSIDSGNGEKHKHVILDSGETIDFTHLVLAIGLPGRYPLGIDNLQREQALPYFATLQARVNQANNVLVIGGGPVGIEVALDVASVYPEKSVTLIHSRDRLAGKYGANLHDACLKVLEGESVRVILGERPAVDGTRAAAGEKVTLSTGETVLADVVVSHRTMKKITGSLLIMCR